MSQYKSVDIVVRMGTHTLPAFANSNIRTQVPNAGVTELGQFLALTMTSGPHPRPVKPNVKTIEINLLAVLDSTPITVATCPRLTPVLQRSV